MVDGARCKDARAQNVVPPAEEENPVWGEKEERKDHTCFTIGILTISTFVCLGQRRDSSDYGRTDI